MQVAECTGANLLRLERNPLALPQPVARPVQAICAREELLTLLELGVTAIGAVGVAVAKELGAVRGVCLQLTLAGIEVVLKVAKARVVLGLEIGGNV